MHHSIIGDDKTSSRSMGLEAGGQSRFEIGAASFRFREVLVSVRE